MRVFLVYYMQVLRTAIRHSWGITETVVAILGIIIPLLGKLIKFSDDSYQTIMIDLAWQVPLCVFLTLFIVRVILAPYQLQRKSVANYAKNMAAIIEKQEQDKRELVEVSRNVSANLSSELDKKDKELAKLRAEIVTLRSGPTIKATCSEVERWIVTGEQLVNEIEKYPVKQTAGSFSAFVPLTDFPPELFTEYTRWVQEAEAFVKERAPEFVQRFANHRGLPPNKKIDSRKAPQFAQSRDEVANRVARFRELLEIINRGA